MGRPFRTLLLLLSFLGVALAIYARALDGPFVSDDHLFVLGNPYIQQPVTARVLLDLLDPWGDPSRHVFVYSPVMLVGHWLEWNAFGEATLGYHLVSVVLHALSATLLAAWLLSCGLSTLAAVLGGLLFLVHPANVEAVAWISQLKATAALPFALGALLAFPARPRLATLLFALGMLVKPTAVFALPAAAVLLWVRGAQETTGRGPWAWLGLWVGITVFCLVSQQTGWERGPAAEGAAYEGPGAQLRTVATLGMRYLVMAASSWGVSAFHEPSPAASWIDPWWIAGLVTGVLLVARLFQTLRRRSIEAAFWVAAAAGFLPVSQIATFLHPLADRYQYFILPGLIGATLCLLRGRGPAWLGTGLAGMLVLGFSAHSFQRAGLWQSETLLVEDAARHYPEGRWALLLRTQRAGREGDADAAVAGMRELAARGYDVFFTFTDDPTLDPIRTAPGFQEAVREIAGNWVDNASRRSTLTQPELRVLARAHVERGEGGRALERIEEGLEVGGPLTEQLVRDRLELERRVKGTQIGSGRPTPDSAALWRVGGVEGGEQTLDFVVYLRAGRRSLGRTTQHSWDRDTTPEVLRLVSGSAELRVEYWRDERRIRVLGRDVDLAQSNVVRVVLPAEVVPLGRLPLRYPSGVDPALQLLFVNPELRGRLRESSEPAREGSP